MEYFDILDNNGKKTGAKKLRPHVHRDGDWHQSIDIWVTSPDQKLLIQQRAPDKDSYPSLWEVSCSGHISSGEEIIPSALRELEEELGLKANAQDLEHLFSTSESHITNNNTFLNNEFKEVFLFVRPVTLEEVTFQKEEIATVKFISLADLEKAITENPENFVPHENIYKKSLEILRKKLSKINQHD